MAHIHKYIYIHTQWLPKYSYPLNFSTLQPQIYVRDWDFMPCSRTTTLNTQPAIQQNGSGESKLMCWNGPVKGQTDLHPNGNLRQAIHRRSPSNLTALELFFKEEWLKKKSSVSRCEQLVDTNSIPGSKYKTFGDRTFATFILVLDLRIHGNFVF